MRVRVSACVYMSMQVCESGSMCVRAYVSASV